MPEIAGDHSHRQDRLIYFGLLWGRGFTRAPLPAAAARYSELLEWAERAIIERARHPKTIGGA
jgi:hypothetical protein